MKTLLLLLAVSSPAADISTSSFDKSVSPCADFYQYACGGWIKANPIPADQSRWGRFIELRERNKELLRGLLEKASKEPGKDPGSKRAGDMYAACMDETAAERKGAEPLKPTLDKIASLRSPAGLPPLLAQLHLAGVDAFFGFDSGQDAKDSELVIAEFDQGGLGLPDRDYYLKDDEKSARLRRQYEWHVARMFGLLGSTPAEAAAEAAAVMRIETALARASLDRVSRRDPEKLYHPMPRAELAKRAPGFDWDRYFAETGAPEPKHINVGVPEFMTAVGSMTASVPIADWRTYLRWHALSAAAPHLSRAFGEESFDFYGRALTGAKERKARWKRCVEAVDGSLGDDLGRLYAEAYYGPEGRKRMAELITALRAALKKDIQGLDWMGAATKERALAKLESFREKIGHPAKWKDYKGVSIDRADLVGSLISAHRWEGNRRLAKIGKPVDRDEWHMTAPTVNAYYNPQMNEIVFPAGILQPPFFDRFGDDAMNLGAIGMVIGHELTHGFDDEGSKFDDKGNLKDWWTPEDLKAFQAKTSCVADQYGSYEYLPGLKANGRLTLGENTADNGGLRVARMALDELPDSNPAKNDAGGFTPEQRFFLGLAGIWCSNETDEWRRLAQQTDPHALGRFRVNGPASNMPEFARAWSCKPGDAMVRAKACRVW